MLGTISGALARSLIYMYIPYHIEWLYIQSWQKNKKKSKKKKKKKKKKNARNNFWGPCQVLNTLSL